VIVDACGEASIAVSAMGLSRMAFFGVCVCVSATYCQRTKLIIACLLHSLLKGAQEWTAKIYSSRLLRGGRLAAKKIKRQNSAKVAIHGKQRLARRIQSAKHQTNVQGAAFRGPEPITPSGQKQ